MHNLALSLKSYTTELDSHAHGYHQLVFPLEGIMEIDVNKQLGQVKDYVGVAIGKSQEHAFSCSHNNRFLIVDMDDETSNHSRYYQNYWNFMIGQPFFVFDESIRSFCHYLAHELSYHRLDKLKSHYAIELLLTSLVNRKINMVNYSTEFQRVVEAIEHNLNQPITIGEIALNAHMSVSKLHRLFKNELGLKPREYLIKRRMEKAAELLVSSKASVSDVAQYTGYQDQSSFSRAFTRYWGASPKAYKKDKYRNKIDKPSQEINPH